jgi:hypothetical protein
MHPMCWQLLFWLEIESSKPSCHIIFEITELRNYDSLPYLQPLESEIWLLFSPWNFFNLVCFNLVSKSKQIPVMVSCGHIEIYSLNRKSLKNSLWSTQLFSSREDFKTNHSINQTKITSSFYCVLSLKSDILKLK